MSNLLREIRLKGLEEKAQWMDTAARMAIAYLRNDPTPEPLVAIKSMTAWNQKQTAFWYDVLKLATEMVQEKNDE